MERELLDREQLRRQHNSLSAQDADDKPFAESLDDYFSTLRPSAEEATRVSEFSAAAARHFEGREGMAAKVSEDYALLLTAVREKIRLTVEWNDTAKLTEKERVKATAGRVGLSVPDKE